MERAAGLEGALEARVNIAQILVSLGGQGPQAARWVATRDSLFAELQALVRNP